MSIFRPVKFYKEDVLPTGNQLIPNALYFIRVGEEFDLYVTTDTTPAVANKIVPGSSLTIDSALSATSTNPVQNKVVDAGIKAHTEATADAHPSSGISHRNSNVADRIDGITEGDVTRDAEGNLTSITTFGEATGFIRDAESNVIGWEDATHIRMIKYTAAGDFDGWTLTEKP